MHILARFLVALFCLLPFSAFASSDDWQVTKATSQVTFTTDNQTWSAVKAGMSLPNGAWISTGPRGRAVLRRNVESITFHPQTLASITTSYSTTRKTSVMQQQGTLDLEIEKRAKPHTTVETPYLAAVVKGTIFSVSVTKGAAKVSVQRGLVGVKSYQSGQQADVAAGQSAAVDAKAGMTTAGVTGKPSITRTRVSVSPVAAAAETATASKASTKSKDATSTASEATDGAASGKGGHSSKGGASSDGSTGNGEGGKSGGKGGNSGSGKGGNEGGKGGKGGSAGGKGGNSGTGSGGSEGGKGGKGGNSNGNGGGKGPGGNGGNSAGGGKGPGGTGNGNSGKGGNSGDGGQGGGGKGAGGKGDGGKSDGGKGDSKGGGNGNGGKGGGNGNGGGNSGHK